MLTCDEYLTPVSLASTFDAMAAHSGRYRLVAGATDLLPWAREGRAGDVHVPVLIDVGKVPELTARALEGAKVRLGAATAFQRFLDDRALMAALPVMPYMAVWFADDQIREAATIGGNLANASPAADGIPALLVLDAEVVIAIRHGKGIGTRTVPLATFIEGPGRTVLRAEELLTEIRCDSASKYGGAFEKVGHRRSLVISTVCVAALVTHGATAGTFGDVRIAVGGIGPVARRMREIEMMLRGRRPSPGLLESAADQTLSLVASRTRRDYRRDVVRGFVVRALLKAAHRAGIEYAAPGMSELEARYG